MLRELPEINGSAIGHVRYSTSGINLARDSQPHVSRIPGIAVAHNGDVINLQEIKERYRNFVFNSGCDVEGILAILACEVPHSSLEDAVEEVMNLAKGAYSVVGLYRDKLFVFRDQHGIRPLVYTNHFYASESVALTRLGFDKVSDFKPGCLHIISKDGVREIEMKKAKPKYCAFEYAYFAFVHSIINNISVMEARKTLGKILAEHAPNADAVTYIPDTPRTAASSLAYEIGLPVKEYVIKDRFAGRIFQKNTQKERDRSAKRSYSIAPRIDAKKMILVDDSIVRGTNIKNVISMLRKRGVKEIHVMIHFPPIRYPCPYGIDFKERKELIAYERSVDEIREAIGADSLYYITKEEFAKALGISIENLCFACVDGSYPNLRWEEVLELEEKRKSERAKMVLR